MVDFRNQENVENMETLSHNFGNTGMQLIAGGKISPAGMSSILSKLKTNQSVRVSNN